MGNPVVHFEIIGTDMAKLSAFYSQLFGWHIDANNPMNYGMVEPQGGEGIGGGVGQGEQAKVMFYVQVADPQSALDQAVALGGRVVQPVMEIPGAVTMAQFADPEGNVIGIVKG